MKMALREVNVTHSMQFDAKQLFCLQL